jgi:hypothetical protein
LNVAADTVQADDLAQQNSAPVAKLRHEATELVPGIGHRKRRRALRHAIARKHCQTVGAPKPSRI